MVNVDPATAPAKLSRIEKLMKSLEAGPQGQDKLPVTTENFYADHDTFRHARQLILDLLNISDKPRGEAIYQALTDKIAAEYSSDEDVGTLADVVRFAKRWTPEIFPASEIGQVHFGRALIESVIAAADRHLAKEAALKG